MLANPVACDCQHYDEFRAAPGIQIIMSATRKLKSSSRTLTVRDTATSKRLGTMDKKTGTWIGRPEELGSDIGVLDAAHPEDRSTVQRVRSVVLAP
jgi:hypothetical protein